MSINVGNRGLRVNAIRVPACNPPAEPHYKPFQISEGTRNHFLDRLLHRSCAKSRWLKCWVTGEEGRGRRQLAPEPRLRIVLRGIPAIAAF